MQVTTKTATGTELSFDFPDDTPVENIEHVLGQMVPAQELMDQRDGEAPARDWGDENDRLIVDAQDKVDKNFDRVFESHDNLSDLVSPTTPMSGVEKFKAVGSALLQPLVNTMLKIQGETPERLEFKAKQRQARDLLGKVTDVTEAAEILGTVPKYQEALKNKQDIVSTDGDDSFELIKGGMLGGSGHAAFVNVGVNLAQAQKTLNELRGAEGEKFSSAMLKNAGRTGADSLVSTIGFGVGDIKIDETNKEQIAQRYALSNAIEEELRSHYATSTLAAQALGSVAGFAIPVGAAGKVAGLAAKSTSTNRLVQAAAAAVRSAESASGAEKAALLVEAAQAKQVADTAVKSLRAAEVLSHRAAYSGIATNQSFHDDPEAKGFAARFGDIAFRALTLEYSERGGDKLAGLATEAIEKTGIPMHRWLAASVLQGQAGDRAKAAFSQFFWNPAIKSTVGVAGESTSEVLQNIADGKPALENLEDSLKGNSFAMVPLAFLGINGARVNARFRQLEKLNLESVVSDPMMTPAQKNEAIDTYFELRGLLPVNPSEEAKTKARELEDLGMTKSAKATLNADVETQKKDLAQTRETLKKVVSKLSEADAIKDAEDALNPDDSDTKYQPLSEAEDSAPNEQSLIERETPVSVKEITSLMNVPREEAVVIAKRVNDAQMQRIAAKNGAVVTPSTTESSAPAPEPTTPAGSTPTLENSATDSSESTETEATTFDQSKSVRAQVFESSHPKVETPDAATNWHVQAGIEEVKAKGGVRLQRGDTQAAIIPQNDPARPPIKVVDVSADSVVGRDGLEHQPELNYNTVEEALTDLHQRGFELAPKIVDKYIETYEPYRTEFPKPESSGPIAPGTESVGKTGENLRTTETSNGSEASAGTPAAVTAADLSADDQTFLEAASHETYDNLPGRREFLKKQGNSDWEVAPEATGAPLVSKAINSIASKQNKNADVAFKDELASRTYELIQKAVTARRSAGLEGPVTRADIRALDPAAERKAKKSDMTAPLTPAEAVKYAAQVSATMMSREDKANPEKQGNGVSLDAQGADAIQAGAFKDTQLAADAEESSGVPDLNVIKSTDTSASKESAADLAKRVNETIENQTDPTAKIIYEYLATKLGLIPEGRFTKDTKVKGLAAQMELDSIPLGSNKAASSIAKNLGKHIDDTGLDGFLDSLVNAGLPVVSKVNALALLHPESAKVAKQIEAAAEATPERREKKPDVSSVDAIRERMNEINETIESNDGSPAELDALAEEWERHVKTLKSMGEKVDTNVNWSPAGVSIDTKPSGAMLTIDWSKGISSALQQVAKQTRNPRIRMVARALAELPHTHGQLRIKAEAGFRGSFDPTTSDVLLNPNELNTVELAHEIFVHEMLHKALRDLIENDRRNPNETSPAARALIKQLRGHLEEARASLLPGGSTAIRGLRARVNEAIQTGSGIADADRDLYGLFDLNEFISELMTNQSFAAKVAAIKRPGGRTLLERIGNRIGNWLNSLLGRPGPMMQEATNAVLGLVKHSTVRSGDQIVSGKLASLIGKPKEYVGQNVADLLNGITPEKPGTAFSTSIVEATNSLRNLLKDSKDKSTRGRGGQTVTFNHSDFKIQKQFEDPIDARIRHATHSSESKYTLPDADKIRTAPLVLSTVRQADLVGDFKTALKEHLDETYDDITPSDHFYLKAYESSEGTVWHTVITDEQGRFITQYSNLNTFKPNSSVLEGNVTFVGDRTSSKGAALPPTSRQDDPMLPDTNVSHGNSLPTGTEGEAALVDKIIAKEDQVKKLSDAGLTKQVVVAQKELDALNQQFNQPQKLASPATKLGQSKFVQGQIDSDRNVEALKEEWRGYLDYTVYGRQEQLDKAFKKLVEFGPKDDPRSLEKAIQHVMDGAPNTEAETAGALRWLIYNMLNKKVGDAIKAGDSANEVYWTKTRAGLMKLAAKSAQTAGRLVDQFKIWRDITPESAKTQLVEQELTKVSGIIGKDQLAELESLRKQLAEINKEKTDEIATKLDPLLTKIDETSKRQGEAKAKREGTPDQPIWQTYSEDMAARMTEQLGLTKIDPKTKGVLEEFASTVERELKSKLQDAVGIEPQVALPKPKVDQIGRIADLLNNWSQVNEAWDTTKQTLLDKYVDDPDATDALEEFAATMLDVPFSEKTLRKAVSQVQQAAGIKSVDLLRNFIATSGQLGIEFQDMLKQRTNLTPAQAASVEIAFRKVVESVTQETKQKLVQSTLSRIEKLNEKRGNKPARPIKLETLMDLSHAGLFTDQDFYEALTDAYGMPKLTEAEYQKAADLGAKIQDLKNRGISGMQVDNANTDLLDFLEQKRGYTTTDWVIAINYVHMLASPVTHGLNVGSNAIRSLLENTTFALGLGIKDPRVLLDVLKNQYGVGAVDGLTEFKSLLKTGRGRARIDDKLGTSNTLENFKFKNALLQKTLGRYADLMKYNTRLLQAEDSFFYRSTQEGAAVALAYKIAEQRGATTFLERKALVQQMLYPISRETAMMRAEAEGLSGELQKMRALELIEQARSGSFAYEGESGTEIANQISLAATYNQEPTGILGAISKAISGWQYLAQLKGDENAGTRVSKQAAQVGLQLIVPFSKVVANVSNAAIDFVPGSMALRYMDTVAGSFQRKQQVAKQAIGLLTMLALFWGDDEKDENGEYKHLLSVQGGGPMDPKLKATMQAAGVKFNSVRIGNIHISNEFLGPLALAASLVGYAKDRTRYQDVPNADVMTIFAGATTSLLQQQISQGMLSGIAGLVEAADKRNQSDSVDAFGKTIARYVSNMVTPGGNLTKAFYRQFFDPSVKVSDIRTMLIKDIPVVNAGVNKRYNRLGEVIENRPLDRAFKVDATTDPIWDYLAQNNMTMEYPPKNEDGKLHGEGDRPYTSDEYARVCRDSGTAIKTQLTQLLPTLRQLPAERAQDTINQVVSSQTRVVTNQIYQDYRSKRGK